MAVERGISIRVRAVGFGGRRNEARFTENPDGVATETEMKSLAYSFLKHGVWVGNVLFPPHRIVSIEIEK
jgi:hypothetical protein